MLKNEIMAHCRLCLVKDDVNIAIFDNLQEICQKISSCLPVKVSKDDKLPKKICDGCNLKLEQFYEFVTASVQAERQLLEWLKDEASASSKADVRVKEELFEQQNAFEETVQAEYVDFKTKHTEDSAKEPPRKRARKAAVKVKPTLSQETDEEDDDLDTVAKVEDESADNSEQEESYEEVPGTSADDQPGPSGLSKGESEAPVRLYGIMGRRLYRKVAGRCFWCKNQQEDLNAHYKSAHNMHRGDCLFQFECDICEKPLKSTSALRDHVKTHETYFPCGFCDAGHARVIDHVMHLHTHCSQGGFICVFCQFSTQDINTISAHLATHPQDENPYICKVCDKSFPLLQWLQEHDNIHKGLEPFRCEECGKSFPYSRYLRAHKLSTHVALETKYKYKCVLCTNAYTSPRNLNLHMAKHTGNNAICDVCGKTLANKERLKQHLLTHTGEKPFKCNHCDKSFRSSSTLIDHKRVHTGERPHSCSYCEKSFTQRSALVIHIRSHTGERPYACHICGKALRAKGMLTVHLKTCQGPK